VWVRDRYERTIGDLNLWIKLRDKAEVFINGPVRFFHYEPLFTRSFSKNIIMPEAVILLKAKM
jgi:hypothetical protein